MRIIKKYDQYIKENKSKKVNEDIEDEFSSKDEIENEDPLDDDGDDMDFPENEYPGDNENELEKDDVGVGNGISEMPAEEYSEEPITPESHEDEGEEEEGHQYMGAKMLGELADKLGVEVSNNSIMYNGKKINFYSETEKFHVDKKKFKTADEVVEYLSSDQPDIHSHEEVSKSRGPEFDDDDDDFEPEFREEENQLDNEVEEEEIEEEPIMQENLKHRSYRQTRTFESFRKK